LSFYRALASLFCSQLVAGSRHGPLPVEMEGRIDHRWFKSLAMAHVAAWGSFRSWHLADRQSFSCRSLVWSAFCAVPSACVHNACAILPTPAFLLDGPDLGISWCPRPRSSSFVIEVFLYCLTVDGVHCCLTKSRLGQSNWHRRFRASGKRKRTVSVVQLRSDHGRRWQCTCHRGRDPGRCAIAATSCQQRSATKCAGRTAFCRPSRRPGARWTHSRRPLAHGKPPLARVVGRPELAVGAVGRQQHPLRERMPPTHLWSNRNAQKAESIADIAM
jgi:hypothetical protein